MIEPDNTINVAKFLSDSAYLPYPSPTKNRLTMPAPMHNNTTLFIQLGSVNTMTTQQYAQMPPRYHGITVTIRLSKNSYGKYFSVTIEITIVSKTFNATSRAIPVAAI